MIRKAIIDTERSNIQTLQDQGGACNGLTSQDLLPDDIFHRIWNDIYCDGARQKQLQSAQ